MRNRLPLRLALAAALALPASAFASGTAIAIGSLRGTNEVPSIITNATGSFFATLTPTSIHYHLSVSGLTGSTLFAHIHVGERHTNGGVSVFLCNSSGSPPSAQPCPQGSGTIEGTITAADVIGPTGQGVDPEEFAALLQAIAAGASYVNVHTSVFPTGEIRSQLLQIGALPTP